MTLFKGLGDAYVRTTDLTGGPSAQKLYPFPVYEFEFAQEADTEDAEAYRAGVRVAEETVETKVSSTLTLKTQITNWAMLGLSLGQLKRTITSFTLPRIKRTTVPTGGVITDPDITTTNEASVLVAIERYGSWGQAGALARTVVAAPTTPAVNTFRVDGSAGTLTFNAAQVGAPIMYFFDRTVASADAYGGSGTLARLGEMEFYGDLFDNSSVGSDGGKIWLPRIQRASRPTVNFSGGLVELETTYTCLLPTGWEEPFMTIDGHSMT